MTPQDLRFFNQTNGPRYASKSGEGFTVYPVSSWVWFQMGVYTVLVVFLIWKVM